VRPQLGLLKSTMLQLDPTFSEKAYGVGSFTDFVERLQKANYVQVTGGEGRYMIRRKSAGPEKAAPKPEEALPVLRDLQETHRIEMDNGSPSEELEQWVAAEYPNFDWKHFGFQEFSELLNYAQDKMLVRINPDEERGLMVYLGPEFHPPAAPAPAPVTEEEPEEEEQPLVPGQPNAMGIIELPAPPEPEPGKPKRRRAPGRKSADGGAPKKRVSRPRKKQPASE
jgi:hypothetical protein